MPCAHSVAAFHEALADRDVARVARALADLRAPPAPLSPTPLTVRDELRRSCARKAHALHDLSLARLHRSCTGRPSVDVDAALTAFAHCVALGAGAAAAAPFAHCLGRLFAAQARACLDRVTTSRAAAQGNAHGYMDRQLYVDALSELVTGATDIMNAVADVADGPDDGDDDDPSVARRVLAPIHEACAATAQALVQLYVGDARVDAWERQAQQAEAAAVSDDVVVVVAADESLQMMDLCLDELTCVLRVLESYAAFVRSLWPDAGAALQGFELKVQELTGVYVLLERFYVWQSVQKATAIAEPQALEASVFVSSVVEDVSFVLNKAFDRASQCLTYRTALSIVIALVDAMESLYLPAILALPSRPCGIPLSPIEAASTSSMGCSNARADASATDAAVVSFSDALLQAVDEDLKRALQEEAKLFMTINSAFMSGKFVQALQEKIDEYSRTSFPHEALILDCLPTPIHDMTEAFHSIVSNEVQEVLSRSMRKRLLEVIRHLMDEQLKYVLTSAEYDAFGSRGSPLVRLIEREVMKNRELRRYERALCSAPFEDLVEAVAQEITGCLESTLLAVKKPCNELGALQLEREVTDILALLSTLVVEKSLRASFTRLFQLLFILNLTQPSHVGDDLPRLRKELSVDTIVSLLQLRVDFEPADVALAIEQVTKAEAATGAENGSSASS